MAHSIWISSEVSGDDGGSELVGDAALPTTEGTNVYMTYMHHFQKMYMDGKKVIAQLEKENLELKQRLEMEEDRRENMEMEILIVKSDLNVERNQRIALEDKLIYMTETLWKNRKSDSLKENQDPSDGVSTVAGSLTPPSSKKAKIVDCSVLADELLNPRSNKRAASPKATATVAPTRKSRRLTAVAKQMEKEEPKKPPPPQVNPKRKNEQKNNFNYGCHKDFVSQPQPQPQPRKKCRQVLETAGVLNKNQSPVVLGIELPSNHGSEFKDSSSFPSGSLTPPRVVETVEPEKTTLDVARVNIQTTNEYFQALQKIFGAKK